MEPSCINNLYRRSTEHHNGTRTVLTKGTTYDEPQNWNEILGENLLPDHTMPISNGNPYSRGNDLSMSYLSTKNDDMRSSHADSINIHHQQTPDIQSGEIIEENLLEQVKLISSTLYCGPSSKRARQTRPSRRNLPQQLKKALSINCKKSSTSTCVA